MVPAVTIAEAGNKCSLSVVGQGVDGYFCAASEARSGNWDLFNFGLGLVAAAASYSFSSLQLSSDDDFLPEI